MSLGDQIAPEFTISQGAKIYGISVSTMRRRLTKGQIVGAYKATGPDGSEWRIPLEAIPSNLRDDAWRIVDVDEPFTITDGQIISTLEGKIAELELIDYKVRILAGKKGTSAVTRVLVSTQDDDGRWDTLGVHENVIAASWTALAEALTYGLLRSGRSN